MTPDIIDAIRKRELRRQKIVANGNALCIVCAGTGIIGYSTVGEPPEIKCNDCNGKGFLDG